MRAGNKATDKCPKCGATIFLVGNDRVGKEWWCPSCGWRCEERSR